MVKLKFMSFKFENLCVWKKALELSSQISDVCISFPKNELFILTTQLKRAADSVCLNIAEGSTGLTNAEQKRFLKYAMSSAVEVVAALFLAKSRKFINDDMFLKLYKEYELLIRMLRSFINRLN
jgi:four helix bundle protein